MRGETEEAFLNRVDRLTEAVIQRAQFEDKYGVCNLFNQHSHTTFLLKYTMKLMG